MVRMLPGVVKPDIGKAMSALRVTGWAMSWAGSHVCCSVQLIKCELMHVNGGHDHTTCTFSCAYLTAAFAAPAYHSPGLTSSSCKVIRH